MPLSERDRRVLAEMERGLLAADGSSVKSGWFRRSSTGSAMVRSTGCTLGVLAGLGYVVLGVVSAGVMGVIGAVIGFAIVVVSCARVLGAYRTRSSAPPRGSRT